MPKQGLRFPGPMNESYQETFQNHSHNIAGYDVTRGVFRIQILPQNPILLIPGLVSHTIKKNPYTFWTLRTTPLSSMEWGASKCYNNQWFLCRARNHQQSPVVCPNETLPSCDAWITHNVFHLFWTVTPFSNPSIWFRKNPYISWSRQGMYAPSRTICELKWNQPSWIAPAIKIK